MITSFNDVWEFIKDRAPQIKVAIPVPDRTSLDSIALVHEYVIPILVGDPSQLPDSYKVIPAHTAVEASLKAASLVRNGDADMLMKGKLPTSVFLKSVLDKEHGIKGAPLLSHIAILECPYYHKLLAITDGGMVIKPSFEDKVQIIKNAVSFVHNVLGVEHPKVAVLAAVETINPKMPETLEAAELAVMGEHGEFAPAEVEGPLALDLAVSKEAGEKKGILNDFIGDADILVVPDVATGNILAKGLLYLGGAKVGGLIIGTTKPCVMLSRADDEETKLNSLSLGILQHLQTM